MQSETVAYSSDRTGPPDLRLLHYNDVYHVEPGSRDPVGGIARFQTVCDYYRHDEKFQGPGLLTLFSGDAFNPSLESSVTKGSHMVPLLNNIGTDAACVGNHDLDFGIQQFRHLTEQCKFPWLLANVLDPGLGDDIPLGNAQKTCMLKSSNGIQIGVIGIVEREWLDTINSLPPSLIFLPAAEVVSKLSADLRNQGASMIIALTHQREPNDVKLAESVPEGTIDLMLGGHDHFYAHNIINGVHLLRSGTDFKQLSYLEAWRKSGSRWDFTITRRDITSAISEDPQTLTLVDQMTSALRTKLETLIGYTSVPLDARFTTVRLRESNIGNFVADLMRCYYSADCCIMAGGTIRGDQVYPPGILRLKDIMNCFPFEDPIVVLRLTGRGIRDALENSVSTYPALEGRFPQVSNIRFSFDARRPPNDRVLSVELAGVPLELEKEYKLATRAYMAHGKDGYTSLTMASEGGPCEEIVSEENGMLISALLRQYFMSLRVMGKWKRWGASMGKAWGEVHEELHEMHPVREKKVAAEDVETHHSKDVNASDVQVKEARKRKHQEDKDVGEGLGAASHGADQHQGSDLVSDALSSRHHAPASPAHPASDSEDDSLLPTTPHQQVSEKERLAILTRRVCRKWWRLAGLQGHPGLVDEEGADGEEFQIGWTRGIAPRVEGRIVCVGGEV